MCTTYRTKTVKRQCNHGEKITVMQHSLLIRDVGWQT